MLLYLIAPAAGCVALGSVGAAWLGYGDVAAGNALGSNILNLRPVTGAARCPADCRSGATSVVVGCRR